MTNTFPFKAVIFDCDGVLVDTEHMTNILWQKGLNELGLELSYEQMLHYFAGKSVADNLQQAAELLGYPVPESFQQKLYQRFVHELQTNLQTINNIEYALQNIALPKAVATNTQRESLKLKLTRARLTDYFLDAVCVEDVDAAKPAPDVYLEAARRLNTNPQDCAAIEDSVVGIRAAAAAGMTVFAYAPGMNIQDQLAAGAVITFDDMINLPELLRNYTGY